MSQDAKAGKRKLTQHPKTKNKSPAPAPAPVPGRDPAPVMEEAEGAALTGTSVNLDAFIWQENVEAGLVVMNLKWRGKTYCGAFIDIEKHNWQPPRIGECAPAEVDHFTRGKNKRSLNSESSEKGDEDTPTKRGRNKGKKRRGPPPQFKKIKKGSEAGSEQQVPSPTHSATSNEEKKSNEEPALPEKAAEVDKSERKAEEAAKNPTPPTILPLASVPATTTAPVTPAITTPTPNTVAPTTPISVSTVPLSSLPTAISIRQIGEKMPEKDESTCQSVINSYSPHSKKVKNANKLTPIPKELYGSESVIRSHYTSPLSMPPIKPFINASPRNLGCVVPNQDIMGQRFEPGDISASKPQVIVKPERRDISWTKHTNLPVLKPQPHFTSHDSNQVQSIHPAHALASLNQQFYKDQQLQQQKKNEHFLPFKPGDQLGHAFKNASLFSKPNMSNIATANEYAFSNLQRHFYQQQVHHGDKQAELMGHEHRPSQEAAQSLLQLSRPFSSKSTPLDQLQYLSRLGNMPVISSSGGPAPSFPPPRLTADSKEELAKLMAFPSMGPKFPIPQVGKFR